MWEPRSTRRVAEDCSEMGLTPVDVTNNCKLPSAILRDLRGPQFNIIA